MGLFWHSARVGNDDVYLQIEQEKLCFKISVADRGTRGERRQRWHERIMEAAKAHGLPVARPQRFGSGWHTTVAILDGGDDFRQAGADGRLDLDATLAVLHQAEQVLSAAAQAAPPNTA